MKVISGKVRSEIRAMTEDGTILHQTILQEDFLAGRNVFAREQRLSVGAKDGRRNRRFVGVRAVGEDSENEKAEQTDNYGCLYPALRNEQVTLAFNHGRLLRTNR